jgi:hypothetical protein
MADIAQVLSTYDALVGVALGAGLTYGFGALNRRHQEAREDKTRWYEARREAYAGLLIAASRVSSVIDAPGKPERPMSELMDELTAAMGAVRLVGSPGVLEAADNLVPSALKDLELRRQKLRDMARRHVERGEVTDEDLDLVEEEIKDYWRAAPIHFPSARAAFEEVARKDLGHPSL